MNGQDVFINCPFTADYQDHFRAIVFAVLRSGFQPRCAQEADDAGEIRFDKICRIIHDSRFGIHDISKTEPDGVSGPPRFNMPMELGLFLGAKRFGPPDQRRKKALVLDREPYRYQAFISDIAGQDIHAHHGDVSVLIGIVATWLREEVRDPNVPGGRAIGDDYDRFRELIPDICAMRRLEPEEITFNDFRVMAAEWIVAANRDAIKPVTSRATNPGRSTG